MLKSTIFRRKYLAMGSCCIQEQEIWDKVVADIMQREKIHPVTPGHVQVMDCVRKFYLEKERAPSVQEICNYTGLSLESFFSLFPDWPHTLFLTDSIASLVLGLPIWNVEI